MYGISSSVQSTTSKYRKKHIISP